MVGWWQITFSDYPDSKMDGHERYFHHPTGLDGQEKPFANTETDADNKRFFNHNKIGFDKQKQIS